MGRREYVVQARGENFGITWHVEDWDPRDGDEWHPVAGLEFSNYWTAAEFAERLQGAHDAGELV